MENAEHRKTSAPYGQACTQCVKAKSRCILRGQGKCERCTRLDKECIASYSVRKTEIKKNRVSKRAQIEDKLDDLVTLLRTQQAVQQCDRATDTDIITPNSSDFTPSRERFQTPYDQSLTEQELVQFRQLHLPHFPLIYLPPSITAEQLAHDKPMTSLAIKTVSTKAALKQAELSKILREKVALRLMVDGEKSLDLLFSILICMTWSFYFTAGKQFLCMFASLAKSLVANLRLDKPSWTPFNNLLLEDKIVLSNESRRALLAFVSIGAIISTTFKYDVMPWPPQLEEHCDKLADEPDCQQDDILVTIARISGICLQVTEMNRHLHDSSENNRYAALHIGSLKASLDELKNRISNEKKLHSTVISYLFTAEVSIYELALLHPANHIMINSPILYQKHIDYLMACLRACRDCIENYLTLDMFIVSTNTSLNFPYCLQICQKLLTLQYPGWNPAVVRETVDTATLLERCAAAAERANAVLKEEIGEDSMLALAAKALREMAPSWRAQLNQETQVGDMLSAESWYNLDASMDISDDFWFNAQFNI